MNFLKHFVRHYILDKYFLQNYNYDEFELDNLNTARYEKYHRTTRSNLAGSSEESVESENSELDNSSINDEEIRDMVTKHREERILDRQRKKMLKL